MLWVLYDGGAVYKVSLATTVNVLSVTDVDACALA